MISAAGTDSISWRTRLISASICVASCTCSGVSWSMSIPASARAWRNSGGGVPAPAVPPCGLAAVTSAGEVRETGRSPSGVQRLTKLSFGWWVLVLYPGQLNGKRAGPRAEPHLATNPASGPNPCVQRR